LFWLPITFWFMPYMMMTYLFGHSGSFRSHCIKKGAEMQAVGLMGAPPPTPPPTPPPPAIDLVSVALVELTKAAADLEAAIKAAASPTATAADKAAVTVATTALAAATTTVKTAAAADKVKAELEAQRQQREQHYWQ
jgi:hypothetical protein